MTTDTQTKRFHREHIAQSLEWINEEIARHPERHLHLTTEDRAMWAGFPAQARAHCYTWVFLDPNHPIFDYMRSGRIGPDYTPTKSTVRE